MPSGRSSRANCKIRNNWRAAAYQAKQLTLRQITIVEEKDLVNTKSGSDQEDTSKIIKETIEKEVVELSPPSEVLCVQEEQEYVLDILGDLPEFE